MRRHARAWAAAAALAVGGCAGPRGVPTAAAPPAAAAPADAGAEALAAYSRRWRAAAESAEQQGRLDDALWAWDVVLALHPQDAAAAGGRDRLQARVEAAVAERWPRARQAAARGDGEAAARLYLEILALAPEHAAAADALRAIERQRAARAGATPRPRAAPGPMTGRGDADPPDPAPRRRPAVSAPAAASWPAR